MNDADNRVYEVYMQHRDELSDEYLRDLVWDIWTEMEARNIQPSELEGAH